MTKHRHETGSHQVIIVVALVLVIIGLLGFVGYNSLQNKSSDAGNTSTVGRKSSQLKQINMNYGDWIQKPSKAKQTKDMGKKVIAVPAKNNASFFSTTDRKTKISNKKLEKFIAANLGKNARLCVTARLEDKPLTSDSDKMDVGVGFVKSGVQSSGSKRFKLQKTYKTLCYNFKVMSKKTYDSRAGYTAFKSDLQLRMYNVDSKDGNIYIKSVVLQVK